MKFLAIVTVLAYFGFSSSSPQYGYGGGFGGFGGYPTGGYGYPTGGYGYPAGGYPTGGCTPYTTGLGSFGPTCSPNLAYDYNQFRYNYYNNPAVLLAQCTINCNATCIALARPSGACAPTTVAPIYNACKCN